LPEPLHCWCHTDRGLGVRHATFDALKQDPAIGRAEALRRAMLAKIEDHSKSGYGASNRPSLWEVAIGNLPRTFKGHSD